MDNQLGLEPTPEAYVENMVAVFSEVRRVLQDDGCVFLNLGDSYASQGGPEPAQTKWQVSGASDGQNGGKSRRPTDGLKPKDLVGIPWMVAFALRSDGWYLRSEIIWAKPNPMPESVTDRPTKAHETVFLLTKSPTYFYDQTAIMEPQVCSQEEAEAKYNKQPHKGQRDPGGMRETTGGFTRATFNPLGRNARSVWTIATQPYGGAHFATMPEELARRCVLAGSSQRGQCPECGGAWERVVERETNWPERRANGAAMRAGEAERYQRAMHAPGMSHDLGGGRIVEHGWSPTCDHGLDPVPDVVLDPFGGSGTTAAVATGNGRDAIYIDLNPAYRDLARERIGPMLCVDAEPERAA